MFTECFGNKVSLLLSITHYCFRNMLLEAWMNLCWHFKNHNKIWWTAQGRAYHENNWSVGFTTFHEEIFRWPAAREIISTHSMSTESSLSEKSRLQLNQIRNIIELKCGLWTWRYHSWTTRIMFQTVSKPAKSSLLCEELNILSNCQSSWKLKLPGRSGIFKFDVIWFIPHFNS